jgi:transposase
MAVAASLSHKPPRNAVRAGIKDLPVAHPAREIQMPPNVMNADRDQRFLLPPDLRDWLPADHLAWFVIDAVAALDTCAFWAELRADGVGRASYDPDLMLAVLIYAYCRGERSSRLIERRLHEDLAYRVIAANHTPDHATIARFRQRHEAALGELFTQALALCARAGMVAVGVVALDGTKIAANASMQANRTREALAEEVARILAEAAETDAAEDALYGPGRRGDEPPPELCDPRSRRERIKKALAELDREDAARTSAHEAHLEARAARERETGKGIRGRRPKAPAPDPAAKANTTDPDSRVQKTSLGFLQGYNAQALVGPGQIVFAAELSACAADVNLFAPVLSAAQENLRAAGVARPIGTVLADAGYLSEANLARPDGAPDRLIATMSGRTLRERAAVGPPRGRLAGLAPIERMTRRLLTKPGRALYKRRSMMIEPVFGQIKSPRAITTFMRRGHAACQSEWRLITLTHNLLKIWRGGCAERALGRPHAA